MTTFQDIFKSSFLERLDSVSLLDTALAPCAGLSSGACSSSLVYKRSYSGVMYSPSFGVTLIALTLITTLLILAVTSNIVLSLGMVGAPVHRPVPHRHQGAHGHRLPVLVHRGGHRAGGGTSSPWRCWGASLWGRCCWCFSRQKNGESPLYSGGALLYVYLFASPREEEQVRALVEARVRRLNLKSKSVAPGQIELNYEVRLREADTGFVNELGAMSGVDHVVLVSYNGDYMG